MAVLKILRFGPVLEVFLERVTSVACRDGRDGRLVNGGGRGGGVVCCSRHISGVLCFESLKEDKITRKGGF